MIPHLQIYFETFWFCFLWALIPHCPLAKASSFLNPIQNCLISPSFFTLFPRPLTAMSLPTLPAPLCRCVSLSHKVPQLGSLPPTCFPICLVLSPAVQATDSLAYVLKPAHKNSVFALMCVNHFLIHSVNWLYINSSVLWFSMLYMYILQ